MEDIEKEIMGEEEVNTEEERDDTIKFNKRGNDDKKRNIIIIVLISISILLIGVIGVLALGKKDKENNNDDNDIESKEVVSTEEGSKEEKSSLFYVSCDDNTALLNVRNSTTGDIIDGISCYKEVTVLEEADATDTCDKWYRVSYNKRGSSYTGYVCSKYIKEFKQDNISLNKIKEVIDKANEYYEENQKLVYCGDTSSTRTVEITTDGNTFEGQYVKSEFNTIDELKSHVLSFLDESLIKVKLELSDYNNPKMYDNYYEIDGNLYCRNYSGKGWMTFYTGNYDIEVESVTDSKVTLKIAYEYIDSDKLTDDTKCSTSSLSSCPNSYFKYVIGSITLNKDGNNYKVTKMDFHD